MKLNLGSGNKKIEGDNWVNIDIDPTVMPDIVTDIANDGLAFCEDNSVDEVRCYDFLEHIPLGQTVFVIEEIYRVLKMNGVFKHHTPSTDGRGAFQDPTHLSFWNINSWFYFCPETVGGRKVCDTKARFKVDMLQDYYSDKPNNVIHTEGIMRKY